MWKIVNDVHVWYMGFNVENHSQKECDTLINFFLKLGHDKVQELINNKRKNMLGSNNIDYDSINTELSDQGVTIDYDSIKSELLNPFTLIFPKFLFIHFCEEVSLENVEQIIDREALKNISFKTYPDKEKTYPMYVIIRMS